MGKLSSLIRALALAATAGSVSALPSSEWTPVSSSPARVSTVYQFPSPLWLENINQRANGLILATELTAANVWQVDPAQPATQTPVLAATIPGKNALLGIAEYAPDVFAVVAALEGANQTFSGWSLYTVDFTVSPVKTSLLADFPTAGLLNGLTYIPPAHAPHPKPLGGGSGGGGILLVSDSALGQIWSLDVATPSPIPQVAAKDPLMVPCVTGTPLGINGLKYAAATATAYFTNFYCQGGFVAAVGVDPTTGTATGPATIVGGPASQQPRTPLDDLALDLARGVAYAAAAPADQLRAVDLATGEARTVAGVANTTEIAQPTAVWLGRTRDDLSHGRVYVSTAGGLGEPINGSVVVGGQVLAVDLGGWWWH